MFQRVSFLVLILSWVLFCSIYSYSIQSKNKEFRVNSSKVNAEILSNIKDNDRSIELAMLAYSIKAPKGCRSPRFNPDINDRGVTIKRPWNDEYIVDIGPQAFENWAILGSTLSHEIEVHCNQNFMWVNFLNLIGLDGTGFAERIAYNYEIANVDRFGLSTEDIESLSTIKDHYYPYLSEKRQPERMFSYIENLVTQFLSLTI